MPNFRCYVCKKFVRLISGEWSYIHPIAALPCSRECMLDWIRKQKGTDPYKIEGSSVSVMELASEVYHAKTKSFYRSRYERYVAEALIGPGIDFRYEAWTFAVGEGSYTPDFYLPLYQCFLEVKGVWTMGQKSKFRKFVQLYGAKIPIMVVPWFIRKDFGFEDEKEELDFTTFLGAG